jgi:hypothetical protein
MYMEIKLMNKFQLIEHCTTTSEEIPVNEFTYIKMHLYLVC